MWEGLIEVIESYEKTSSNYKQTTLWTSISIQLCLSVRMRRCDHQHWTRGHNNMQKGSHKKIIIMKQANREVESEWYSCVCVCVVWNMYKHNKYMRCMYNGYICPCVHKPPIRTKLRNQTTFRFSRRNFVFSTSCSLSLLLSCAGNIIIIITGDKNGRTSERRWSTKTKSDWSIVFFFSVFILCTLIPLLLLMLLVYSLRMAGRFCRDRKCVEADRVDF